MALGLVAVLWVTVRLRTGRPALEGIESRPGSRVAREAWAIPRDVRGDPAPAGTVGRLGTVRLRHGGAVRAVAFSPDGRAVASASDDGTVSLWDQETGLEIRRLPTWAPARAVAFSPDGSRLAGAASDDTAWLWDAATGDVVARMLIPGKDPARSAEQQGVAFSEEGAALFTTSTTGVDRWRARDGRHERRVESVPAALLRATGPQARSPDGQALATGQDDGRITLQHVASRATLGVLEGHVGPVHAVAFSPDGTHLVSGGADHAVRLWDLARSAEEEASAGPAGAVRALAFSEDGGALYAAHADGSLRSWGRGGSRRAEARWEGGTPRLVSLSPSRLLVAGPRRARVLDAETLTVVEEIPFPGGARGLAVAPGAGRIAVGGDLLRVFTLGSTAPETIRLPAPEEPAAFSEDGRVLATFRRGPEAGDRALLLRDAESGRELAREAHRRGGPHPSTCASADGRHLVYNGALQRVESGPRRPHLVTVAGAGRGDLCVVSPGGEWAAVREWSRRSVALFGRSRDVVLERFAWLEGHRGDVSAIALSPDGAVLATGGEDGTVLLWDPAEVRGGVTRSAGRPEPRWPPEPRRVERGAGAEVVVSFDEGLRGRGIDPVVFPVENGPVRLVEGRVGRAAAFDRGLEFPETGSVVLGDEFTFAAWFALPGAVPAPPAIAAVVRSDLVTLDVREGGRPVLFLHFPRQGGHASLDLTPWTGGPIVADRWYHVAVSYRRPDGVPRVCVDGACGPGPQAFNYSDRPGVLTLGGGWSNPPPVAVDELLVRDVALTDDEMAALAGQAAPRPLPTAAPTPRPPAEEFPAGPAARGRASDQGLDGAIAARRPR